MNWSNVVNFHQNSTRVINSYRKHLLQVVAKCGSYYWIIGCTCFSPHLFFFFFLCLHIEICFAFLSSLEVVCLFIEVGADHTIAILALINENRDLKEGILSLPHDYKGWFIIFPLLTSCHFLHRTEWSGTETCGPATMVWSISSGCRCLSRARGKLWAGRRWWPHCCPQQLRSSPKAGPRRRSAGWKSSSLTACSLSRLHSRQVVTICTRPVKSHETWKHGRFKCILFCFLLISCTALSWVVELDSNHWFTYNGTL